MRQNPVLCGNGLNYLTNALYQAHGCTLWLCFVAELDDSSCRKVFGHPEKIYGLSRVGLHKLCRMPWFDALNHLFKEHSDRDNMARLPLNPLCIFTNTTFTDRGIIARSFIMV